MKSTFYLKSFLIYHVFAFLFSTQLSAQTRHWATYYGGSEREYTYNVVCGAKDSSVILGGATTSLTNIATPGAYQDTNSGSSSDYIGFIAKFNSNGTRLWGTYFGGKETRIFRVKTNSLGEIIICGQTTSNSFIATSGAYQTTLKGSNDGFIAKFSASGNLIWSTYFGGNNTENVSGIAIDENNDDIIVSGGTTSDSIGIKFSGVHQNSLAGNSDAFIAKFSTNGTIKWLSYFGGSENDAAGSLCTDKNGNIYFSGGTLSKAGIATINGFKNSHFNTIGDGYFGIFSSNGQLKYGTYFGSENREDNFSNIAIDNFGGIYLVGYTKSLDSIATVGASQVNYGGGGTDGFLVKFDTLGDRLWSTYIGGISFDELSGLTIGPDGNVYVGGFSNGGISTTPGAHQEVIGGGTDAIVASFSSTGTKRWLSYFGGSVIDIVFDLAFNSNNKLLGCGTTASTAQISTSGAHQTAFGGNVGDAFLLSFNTGTIAPIDSSIRNNLIGSNQFLCGSQLPNAILGQLPSGGNGTFSYLWLQSTSGSSGPFSPASGLNTSQNYSPGLPTASTWYKRVVFSSTQTTESNVVQISNGGSLKAGFVTNANIQCERDNLFTFSDTTTVPDIITRRWDFGDGNTGSNTIENYTYTFGTINYFNVKLYLETASGCKDSMTKTVYLIPNPQPNTINGDTSVKRLDRETYTVTANTGYQYNWWLKRGLGTINKLGNSAEVAWTKSWGTDTLYCQEQTGGGCYGDTLMLKVNINPANGEEELAMDGISLFPNPVEDAFELRLPNRKEFSYQILNVFGAEIGSGKVTDVNSKINVQEWSKGYYFIRVIDSDGKSYTTKFLIADN